MKFVGKRSYEFEFAQDFLEVLFNGVSIFNRDPVLSDCVDRMKLRLEELEPSISTSFDIDQDFVFYFSDID